MNQRIWQSERSYHRRILYVTPLAALIVAALFLTSDRVSIDEIERHVGWKGELRLMPDITIIPDDELVNVPKQERDLLTMTTVDLDLPEGSDIDSPVLENVDSPEEIDQIDFPESEDYLVRTLEAHREVPYSQEYVILKMVEPKYPPPQLEAGIEGSVLVQLFVNEHGAVAQAYALYWTGSPEFRDSALDAVRQFVFQPPLERGAPSPMWIKFMVKFRIYG